MGLIAWAMNAVFGPKVPLEPSPGHIPPRPLPARADPLPVPFELIGAPPEEKYEWPYQRPPKDDAERETYKSWVCGNGWSQFKLEEYEPGKWKWVVDVAAQKAAWRREKEREDLLWALKTRVLTEKEMRAVRQYDYHLCIGMSGSFMSESFSEREKRAEFDRALAMQTALQRAEKNADPRPLSEAPAGGYVRRTRFGDWVPWRVGVAPSFPLDKWVEMRLLDGTICGFPQGGIGKYSWENVVEYRVEVDEPKGE